MLNVLTDAILAVQTLFKKMAQSGSTQPKKLTLEAGPMCFHYIIANNVAFLTLAERGYPKVMLQISQ
jgi:hypothetical protein